MQPLVLDIPGTPKNPFTLTIPVDGALLDLSDAEVRFPTPGTARVDVEPVNEGFLLTGLLEIRVQLDCSRCLAPVMRDVSEGFRIVLSRDPAGGDTDDDWVFLAKDERLFDLAPIVRDLILVALPAKPLCSDSCMGLCPECGSDRNRVQCRCTSIPVDPRWAALQSLRAHEDPPEREEAIHGTTEEKDIEEPA
ncbi:MAG: DUF177 domain-containing protein [Candidatus Eisenbacteria bacterium]|jgi:uncharacterized protein|nr:DUF177 domain-containing protein [Candidatus Eisenbacteria bacterium]